MIHEKYLPEILAALERYKNDPKIDALLFNYLHFYGSYDFVGDSYQWYRNEIRVVRNDPKIYSYRDAQGFRKGENLPSPAAKPRRFQGYHPLVHGEYSLAQCCEHCRVLVGKTASEYGFDVNRYLCGRLQNYDGLLRSSCKRSSRKL